MGNFGQALAMLLLTALYRKHSACSAKTKTQCWKNLRVFSTALDLSLSSCEFLFCTIPRNQKLGDENLASLLYSILIKLQESPVCVVFYSKTLMAIHASCQAFSPFIIATTIYHLS